MAAARRADSPTRLWRTPRPRLSLSPTPLSTPPNSPRLSAALAAAAASSPPLALLRPAAGYTLPIVPEFQPRRPVDRPGTPAFAPGASGPSAFGPASWVRRQRRRIAAHLVPQHSACWIPAPAGVPYPDSVWERPCCRRSWFDCLCGTPTRGEPVEGLGVTERRVVVGECVRGDSHLVRASGVLTQ